MGKVYMLLRNNVEAGPFGLEDLLKQNLRTSDLIWVEGESTLWQEPSKLEELKFALQTPPRPKITSKFCATAAAKAPIVPNPFIDQGARLISMGQNREAAAFPRTQTENIERKPEVNYERDDFPSHHQAASNTIGLSTPFLEENNDRVELFIHKKRRNQVNLPELLAAGLVTAFVASGLYGGWTIINKKEDSDFVTTAIPVQNFEVPSDHYAKPAIVKKEVLPINDSTQKINQPVAVQKVPPKKKTPKPNATLAAVSKTDSTKKQDTLIETAPVVSKEEPIQVEAEPEKTEVVQQPEPQKKSLGQSIKNLFKKKKNKTSAEPVDDKNETDSLDNSEN